MFSDPRPDGDEKNEDNLALDDEVTAEGLPRLRQKIQFVQRLLKPILDLGMMRSGVLLTRVSTWINSI